MKSKFSGRGHAPARAHTRTHTSRKLQQLIRSMKIYCIISRTCTCQREWCVMIEFLIINCYTHFYPDIYIHLPSLSYSHLHFPSSFFIRRSVNIFSTSLILSQYLSSFSFLHVHLRSPRFILTFLYPLPSFFISLTVFYLPSLSRSLTHSLLPPSSSFHNPYLTWLPTSLPSPSPSSSLPLPPTLTTIMPALGSFLPCP